MISKSEVVAFCQISVYAYMYIDYFFLPPPQYSN